MNDRYSEHARTALLTAAKAEHDFAGWLAAVLSSVAAELGSSDALTVARPGSSEAELVQRLVKGTVGWGDEYLAIIRALRVRRRQRSRRMVEMAESELGFPYKGWERFFDAIGPGYGAMLRGAIDRARAQLGDADDDQLASLVAEGRKAASSLDEEGARLTVRLHEERDQEGALAESLEQQAQEILQQAPRALSRRMRAEQRQARIDAAERSARTESHRQLAADAQEQIRALGEQGRHLYHWFDRNRDALAMGLTAEQQLDTANRAAYHVLGAPSIAPLTAACLNADRAIDLGQLGPLVQEQGNERQQLLLDVAIALRSGDEREVTLNELLEQLHGEDLDRVLEGVAIRHRRPFRGAAAPTDLWIRAAEPDREPER